MVTRLYATGEGFDSSGDAHYVAPEEILELLEAQLKAVAALDVLEPVTANWETSNASNYLKYLREVTAQKHPFSVNFVIDVETGAVYEQYSGFAQATRIMRLNSGGLSIPMPEVQIGGEWVSLAYEYSSRLPSLEELEQSVKEAEARAAHGEPVPATPVDEFDYYMF